MPKEIVIGLASRVLLSSTSCPVGRRDLRPNAQWPIKMVQKLQGSVEPFLCTLVHLPYEIPIAPSCTVYPRLINPEIPHVAYKWN